MTRRTARAGLGISALLFVAWLGYLGYLAATDARPPVVSFPQLLAATAEVVARVEADPDGQPARRVTVVEVLRGQGLAPDQAITVTNLPDVAGYTGPGDYLIPLAPPEGGPAGGEPAYAVPRPARSPGSEFSKAPPQPLIYPWIEAVQRQYRRFHGQ
jgi:hypothetical protein